MSRDTSSYFVRSPFQCEEYDILSEVSLPNRKEQPCARNGESACRLSPTYKEEVSAVEESGTFLVDNPLPVLPIQAKSTLYPLEIRPYTKPREVRGCL